MQNLCNKKVPEIVMIQLYCCGLAYCSDYYCSFRPDSMSKREVFWFTLTRGISG